MIRIEKKKGCFIVHQGTKNSGELTFDEMLAQVVHLTYSASPGRPFQMETAKQRAARKKRWREIHRKNKQLTKEPKNV